MKRAERRERGREYKKAERERERERERTREREREGNRCISLAKVKIDVRSGLRDRCKSSITFYTNFDVSQHPQSNIIQLDN